MSAVNYLTAHFYESSYEFCSISTVYTIPTFLDTMSCYKHSDSEILELYPAVFDPRT